MTQVLNFILKHQPPTWPEFEEICPDGGVIPDCDIRVDPDYWGIPPPTETYGALEVINCPMESLTAKCGASVSVWMRPGCPAETPDVVCDTVQNPTEIDPNSSENIYILDGAPPYNWEIVGGHGFSLEWEVTGDAGGRPDGRLNSWNILYSSSDSCGTAQVKITDNCLKEVICEFVCTESLLDWDTINSGKTVVKNGSVAVFVLDGTPPFTWDVFPSNFSMHSTETFSRDNTVYADGSACGIATVTVEDACGGVTEGTIKCTSGSYVQIDSCTQGTKFYYPQGPYYSDDLKYMIDGAAYCDSGYPLVWTCCNFGGEYGMPNAVLTHCLFCANNFDPPRGMHGRFFAYEWRC